MELDGVPLWRGDHVEIRQLVEDFARYLYLPRLKNPAVLAGAVRDGLRLLTWEQDSFAYADSFDEAAGRYRGLRAGQNVPVSDTDPTGLIVKPEVARRQFDAEEALVGQAVGPRGAAAGTAAGAGTPGAGAPADAAGPRAGAGPAASPHRRFHGSVALDPLRAGADAGRIAREVIAHLAGLPGAQVRVTLEIEAQVPDGVPDHVERIVTENSRTLKFTTHGFEPE
jgi:hypothetical protein